MNTRTLLAVLCSAVIFAETNADEMTIKNQSSKTFKETVSRDLQIDYLLFLPNGYEQEKEKRTYKNYKRK